MNWLIAQADVARLPLADQSVDLVVGSPPYVDARLYLEDGRDLGIARGIEAWITWMLGVTAECLRVSRGPVVWVAAGKTKDRNYWPVCEGLMYRWWQAGGHAYRPVYWHRVGIPGSGGDQWFRADIEYCMCFKRPGKLAWTDNTAMGHPPKWAPGGAMSNRMGDGKRVNAHGVRMDGVRIGARRKSGKKYTEEHPAGNAPTGRKVISRFRPGMHNQDQDYAQPAIANPGNLLHTVVGGGAMGHEDAHENEAPYPEKVPDFFIRSLCPVGGLILDPFGGSGTTVVAAEKAGRVGIGFDLRASQCRLMTKRLANEFSGVVKQTRKRDSERIVPMPGQLSLWGDVA